MMISEYLAYVLGMSLILTVGYILYFYLKNKAEQTKTKKDDLLVNILVGIPFILLDYKVNWLISPIFVEFPKTRKELVTGRVKRYKALEPISRLDKFRHWFGVKLCSFLEKYDPGHCDI